MRKLFTGLSMFVAVSSVSALAQPRSALRLICDNVERVLIIDQISYENNKARVSGSEIAVQGATVPEAVDAGTRNRRLTDMEREDDKYHDLENAGIKNINGQTVWYWSAEQEQQLQAAWKRAVQSNQNRGRFSSLISKFTGEETPESVAAWQLFAQKKEAFLKRDAAYSELLKIFTETTPCERIGINVEMAERVEVECSTMQLGPVSVGTVVPASLKRALMVLKGATEDDIGVIRSMRRTMAKGLSTGTYDACDGFETAK